MRVKRIAALTLIFIWSLASFSLAQDSAALIVNGQSISQAETLVYILKAEKEYEEIKTYYESFLGIDYWNIEYANGMTVKEMVKADVFREITMLHVFYQMALDLNMSLTDDERNACRDDARAFYESMNVLLANRIDVNDLTRLFEKQLLADRMYSILLGGLEVDEQEAFESVNPDDYITYEIEYLFHQNLDFDENGAGVPLSNEKRQLIISEMEKAKSAESLMNEAERLSAMDIFYGETTVVSKNPSVDVRLLEVIAGLQPSETSDVTETDFGLFLLRLTDNTDQSAYNQAIESAIYDMRFKAFEGTYNELYASAEYEINVAFWDSLNIGSSIPPSEINSSKSEGKP